MAIHFSPPPPPPPPVSASDDLASPSRRRSARLTVPQTANAEPSTSSSSVVFPQSASTSTSEPSTPLRTRSNLRKRARPSDLSELASPIVVGVAQNANGHQQRSPEKPTSLEQERVTRARVKGKEKEVEAETIGMEKKRRRLSISAAIPEEQTRVRTRSTAMADPSSSLLAPARPNHRKRKSLSALDDIKREQLQQLAAAATSNPEEEQESPAPKKAAARKKARKSLDADIAEDPSEVGVTFLLDGVPLGNGKGRERETSPRRSLRSTSAKNSTAADDGDVQMEESSPTPKLRTRRSTRKLNATPTESPSAAAPTSAPLSPTTLRRASTPLGAAAAILASTVHSPTLPPSALPPAAPSPPPPSSTATSPRRFTRSSLAGAPTQRTRTQPQLTLQVHITQPQSQGGALMSPPTSPLSPVPSEAPGSPLLNNTLDLSPTPTSLAQTQAKAPAKLRSASSPTSTPVVPTAPLPTPSPSASAPVPSPTPISTQPPVPAPIAAAAAAVVSRRRIATRSSGLPLVEGESMWSWHHAQTAQASSTRRRSPLVHAASESTTEGASASEAEASSQAKGKGKGKKKKKVGGVAPARRSSRLSGVVGAENVPAMTPSSSPLAQHTLPVQQQPVSQQLQKPPPSHPNIQIRPSTTTPPSSPPSSPPPLRLSLASLSPPVPVQSQGQGTQHGQHGVGVTGGQGQGGQPGSGNNGRRHEPHTRSPLSTSSSDHQTPSGVTSTSPIKEAGASLPSSSSPTPTPSLGSIGGAPASGNAAAAGPSVNTHTPPGSPTRSPVAILEALDAVDFGTMVLPPSLTSGGAPPPSSRGQQGQEKGKEREERPGSPTSPTDTRGGFRGPLVPSMLLASVGSSTTSLASASGSEDVGAAPQGKGKAGVKVVEDPTSSAVPVSVVGSSEAGENMEKEGGDEAAGIDVEMQDVGVSGGDHQVSEAATSAIAPTVIDFSAAPIPHQQLLDSSTAVSFQSAENVAPTTPALAQQIQDTPAEDDEQSRPSSPYPPLIQVEIPPAPQQDEQQQQQQFVYDQQGSAQGQQQQQQPQQQQQYQQQYVPPPQYWEEPPRLDNERNLWRLACKVRVWDLRRRYSLETIRNLVTNEAHEYYANHGFPAGYFTSSSSSSSSSNPPYPSGSSGIGYGNAGVTMLRSPSPSRMKRQVSGSSDGSDGGATGSNPTSPVNFMDEPVYDWEIAMSDEEEVEGEGGFGPEDEEEEEEDVDDDEDDDEDYEEYEDEEGGDVVEHQQQDGSATEVDAEHAADKENATQEEVSAEAEEEERMKRRRRRRSSLLRHIRKESGGGESEEGSSPDPEGPSSPGDDKTKADGEVDDAVMDVDIDLDIEDLDEALGDPNFNLELSSCASASASSGSPTSPQQMSSPSSPSATSPSSSQANGVFTAFYVPPVQVFAPQPLPAQDSSSSALGGALGGTAGGEAATTTPGSSPSPDGTSSLLIDPGSTPSPPATPPPPAVQQVQLPLQTIQIPMHIPSPTPPPIVDLPPPRLSSVPVWALRNMEMLGGSMGKGTPVNRDRADEWARAWSSAKGPSTMARSLSADGSAAPAENSTNDGSKREADFRMEVDSAEGGGRREGELKPVLRLSLPGDDLDVSTTSGNAAASNQIQPQGAAGPADSNPASSSCKQSMLVDTAFEPQNQAAWDAFLASLGDPLTTAPLASSSSSSSGVQQTAQQGMVVHDLRGAPPPYSSLHPPHSPPPPTPTPPSPASSTCSLSQESTGSPGSPGPSVTIHSPGTSANNGGMMNPMFGMMNVNMMFGVPGAQSGGGNGGYAPHQGAQMQQQLMPQQQQQQQGVSEGSGGANGQQCFPAMGLTMSMPPPGSAAAMGMTASMGGPSFNNGPSFNSMPSFNMGMGLGMNPATMNMNVPLNMGMGMPMPMSMQMPMSMPFAGLQLGLTLSLAPQQHSAQQQQQQNQGQLQWSQGGSVVQGNGGQVPGVDFDLASLGVPGNGMGIGPGGEGMNMFSLVNASTPANTPLNSPLSPSSSSIPSSMLGVLGSGPPPTPKDNEKGPSGMGGGGAGATPSTLSYALG